MSEKSDMKMYWSKLRYEITYQQQKLDTDKIFFLKSKITKRKMHFHLFLPQLFGIFLMMLIISSDHLNDKYLLVG